MKSIKKVIEKLGETLEEDIEKISPLQRIRLWMDLQEYEKPKLSRIEKKVEKKVEVKQVMKFGQMEIEF